MKPPIVVCAYSQVGYACLNYLLQEKENVVAVFTHLDKVGEKIWFESCEALAQKHAIPVHFEINSDLLMHYQPALLFSFYYRHMIPVELLDIPTMGCFNMHGSLLPNYRGRAPLNWALIHGEEKAGASLHEMVKKPDAGAILDQEAFDLTLDDTAGSASKKLEAACVTILKRQLPLIKTNTAVRHLNDLSKGSYFSGRKPEDGQIHSSMTVKQAYDMIRALSPKEHYPPATFISGNDVFELYQAKPVFDERSFEKPGAVLLKTDDRLKISLKDGFVLTVTSYLKR